MLTSDNVLAIYMEETLGKTEGKMGYGVLRYCPSRVACVIDSTQAGRMTTDVIDTPRDCPVVEDVAAAAKMGADTLLLGIAPSGGRIPESWFPAIDAAVSRGMNIVNGLHAPLAERCQTCKEGQWIWDIRREPPGLGIARARARKLPNRRLLVVGTDMANGKMTSALEMVRAAKARGVRAAFLATGQIGIAISGGGVPVDAVRADYACGAIEKLVLDAADAELVAVEGQGSLFHPGSSATLPLLRGSCPTHLLLCHRAGLDTLIRVPEVRIPPLKDCVRLYEDVAEACGVFDRPKTIGISLNTALLTEDEAVRTCERVRQETGLQATDPLRFGVEGLLDSLLQ